MKSITLPKLEFTDIFPPFSEFSENIQKNGVKILIDAVNWPQQGYVPEIMLFSGYTDNEILLKYRVKEQYIRAVHTEINAPVFEDSCVEFFISSGNGYYYNFEFNCIGTVFAGYGRQREGREVLSGSKVSKIRTYSTLGEKEIPVREISDPWELTVVIPFTVFYGKEFYQPSGKIFNANFYKCGDKLPVLHYLSWNPIHTGTPDFHRPEFFGEIKFA